MLKNTQSKIILVICVIEILLIVGLGIFAINSLNEISNEINQKDIMQVNTEILDIANQVQLYIIVAIVIAIVISLIIAIFLSKYVMYPINKLLESAEEIKKEETKKTKKNKKK